MKIFLSRKWHTNAGFTAIEAIMVILVIGILASILVYRYNITHDTGTTVATDELIADIQYVQAKAMAAGTQQSIAFTIGSGIYNIPGEQKRLPDGINITATTLPGNTITFNTLGEPTFGNSDRTITLAGSRTVTIYAITGKVE
jgi:prepilin-type N-terminal cleavage/methylation domain-containing protein